MMIYRAAPSDLYPEYSIEEEKRRLKREHGLDKVNFILMDREKREYAVLFLEG